MVTCSPEGKLAAVVTKVYPDPHAGYVATVRIFSGRVVKGEDVLLVGAQKSEKVQQVSIYKGSSRISMDEVVAGNIVGIVGLKEAGSGETLATPSAPIEGFEAIQHLFEPVVTKAIEPKSPKQLAKLIAFLKKVSREDPTLRVKINEDTGEYIVSGLGELHINAKVENKLKEEGIDVDISPPIVIYKEGIRGYSPEPVEGKSPNKHNRFYVVAEKLEDSVMQAMAEGKVNDQEIKKKDQELIDQLVELGMNRDEVRKVKMIYNRNMLLDTTVGVGAILEIMEMLKQSFKEAMDEGPMAREPVSGLKIKLVDAKLHEDAIHRGPAQVIPAVRRAIRDAILSAKPYILEPKQIIRIDVPSDQMGGATKEVNNRRGQILEMKEERGTTQIKSKLPVSEMFGFNSALKSATGGTGFYYLVDVIYEPLPKELEQKIVTQIKTRKGITGEEEKEED
jgi:elongation factor 2